MRTQIAVDDVREISGFMRLTPAEGGWRVVVVDGAEDLNQNSANALLKVLEEPPPRAVLLLVCAAPGRLLPTIRSRCRRLRLTPLAGRRDGPAAGRATCRTCAPTTRPAGHARRRLARPRAAAGARRRAWRSPPWWTRCWPRCPTCRPARALRRGRRAGRERERRSPPSWTCCAPASPPRCATRCAAAPTRSRRAWSRCVPLMPGARCGTALTRLQDETERLRPGQAPGDRRRRSGCSAGKMS